MAFSGLAVNAGKVGSGRRAVSGFEPGLEPRARFERKVSRRRKRDPRGNVQDRNQARIGTLHDRRSQDPLEAESLREDVSRRPVRASGKTLASGLKSRESVS